jgi:ABC-type Zn uptake system ZnuABC Zn-binding protein ZnuA
MRSSLVALVAVLVALMGGGCGNPNPANAKTQVVATTTVLADLVARVGGPDVVVSSLVPRGGEVHTFDPSPGDLARVTEARLVVVNGLGLDDWAVALADDADVPHDRVVALAPDLAGVEYLGDDGPSRNPNPHLWLDVRFAMRYVERIAERLAQGDPAHATAYRERAASYREELAALDDWARVQLEAIPADRRSIVSFHDALPYFARAYGLTISGVVVDAPGQDPSAGEIADLVARIRAAGVRAIVSEVQFAPDLAQTIAAETGATVIADLYTDSLGDPPVDSYEGLIRYDVGRLVDALR